MFFISIECEAENSMDELSNGSEVLICNMVLESLNPLAGEVFIIQMQESLCLVNWRVFKKSFLESKDFICELVEVPSHKILNRVPRAKIVINWLISENTDQKAKHATCPEGMLLRFLNTFNIDKGINVDGSKCIN